MDVSEPVATLIHSFAAVLRGRPSPFASVYSFFFVSFPPLQNPRSASFNASGCETGEKGSSLRLNVFLRWLAQRRGARGASRALCFRLKRPKHPAAVPHRSSVSSIICHVLVCANLEGRGFFCFGPRPLPPTVFCFFPPISTVCSLCHQLRREQKKMQSVEHLYLAHLGQIYIATTTKVIFHNIFK